MAKGVVRALRRDVELEHLLCDLVVHLDGQAVRLRIPQKRDLKAVARAPPVVPGATREAWLVGARVVSAGRSELDVRADRAVRLEARLVIVFRGVDEKEPPPLRLRAGRPPALLTPQAHTPNLRGRQAPRPRRSTGPNGPTCQVQAHRKIRAWSGSLATARLPL